MQQLILVMCYFPAACLLYVQSMFKRHIKEAEDLNTTEAKIMKKNPWLPEIQD